MKPIKVTHLSLAFTTLVLLALMGFSALMWGELQQVSERIRSDERAAAARELDMGIRSLEERLRATADTLAKWDETRQQLIDSEYYALWRDLRVRDAGMVPDAIKVVALYDKSGVILDQPRGEQMPSRLRNPLRRVQFVGNGEPGQMLVLFPVHADPEGRLLLGYGALKTDVIGQLRELHAFRYIDIASVRLGILTAPSDTLPQLIAKLDYEVVPNHTLANLGERFQVTFMRLLGALLVILILGGWLFNRAVVKPLNSLSRDIDNLKNTPGQRQESEFLEHPIPVMELENVRRSFSDYHEKLLLLREDLEKSSKDFFDQARQDALTGAYNRRAFDEDWRSLADAGYLGRCGLLLFDCDHFKAINDTYGHGVGDRVIQAIAQNLTAALRTGDRLYRLGGDEFATMLPNSDSNSAEAVAERCLHHIQSHDFTQYGLREPVSVSIGVAMSEHTAFSLHELQTHADLAMYSAKRPGNRKIVFHGEGDTEGMASLVSNLRVNAVYGAVQRPECIQPHYQAIVSLPDGKPIFYEALARIRHGEELLAPPEFLPIVRNHRIEVEFDLAVLRSVEEDIRIGRVKPGYGLSINVSPVGILDERVIQGFLGMRSRAKGRPIVVEISELGLIAQLDKAEENIKRLREVGCQVALDDFGSGYSSLRMLSSMPVDIVKFDISMIHLLTSACPKQHRIVGEVANIIRANGYAISAEGVETREHLDNVIGLGFNFAQGYYFD